MRTDASTGSAPAAGSGLPHAAANSASGISVLQHHCEAGELTETADRGLHKRIYLHVAVTLGRHGNAPEDRIGGVVFASTIGPVAQGEEALVRVLAARAAATAAPDGVSRPGGVIIALLLECERAALRQGRQETCRQA